PHNIGGRTRAFGVDINNEDVLIAGGISGGIWRSANGGQSWVKVTKPEQHNAVSCLVQDTRPGKTNIWYTGSGEAVGNSASATFSAYYLGNGMLKSIDGGLTWDTLSSTVSNSPQS